MSERLPKHERELRTVLAHNVRRLRDARGWTQETAAEHLGIAPTHVQKLEYGIVNVTLKTLGQLCRGFAVPAHELLCVGEGGGKRGR